MKSPPRLKLCVLAALAVLGCDGCKKSPPAGASAPDGVAKESMPPAGPRVTACDLATEDEVAAVQRTPITATKSNEVPTGEFVASQCYYAATEPASSVTIAVIQRDAARPSKRSVRRYWESTFGKFRERRGDDVEEIEKDGTAQREEEDSGG